MKLTEKILKQLILEALGDESPLEGMIKSGQWPMINQALTATVDVGLPLVKLPWVLLPVESMDEEDLAELGQYLLDNGYVPPPFQGDPDWPHSPNYKMTMGLRAIGPNRPAALKSWVSSKFKNYVQDAIKITLGIQE